MTRVRPADLWSAVVSIVGHLMSNSKCYYMFAYSGKDY